MSEQTGAPLGADVTPEQFASLIAGATDAQLAEGMSGERRSEILGAIMARMADHVDPARARGTDAVMHWRITGRPDGGEDVYEVVLRDGTCTASATPEHEPRVTLKIDGIDFLKLVSGAASGPLLFMSGKLKVQGDMMFAAGAAGLFRIPRAAA